MTLTPRLLEQRLTKAFADRAELHRQNFLEFERWYKTVQEKGYDTEFITNEDFGRLYVDIADISAEYPADGAFRYPLNYRVYSPEMGKADLITEGEGIRVLRSGQYTLYAMSRILLLPGAVPGNVTCRLPVAGADLHHTGRTTDRTILLAMNWTGYIAANTLIKIETAVSGTPSTWHFFGGAMRVQRLHSATDQAANFHTQTGNPVTLTKGGAYAIHGFCHAPGGADQFEITMEHLAGPTSGAPLRLNRELEVTTDSEISWIGFCPVGATFTMRAYLWDAVGQTEVPSTTTIFAQHLPLVNDLDGTGTYQGSPARARYWAGPQAVIPTTNQDNAGTWTLSSSDYPYSSAVPNGPDGIVVNATGMLAACVTITSRSVVDAPAGAPYVCTSAASGQLYVGEVVSPTTRMIGGVAKRFFSNTNLWMGWSPSGSVFANAGMQPQPNVADTTWQIYLADIYVLVYGRVTVFAEVRVPDLHVPHKFTGKRSETPNVRGAIQSVVTGDTVTADQLEQVLEKLFNEHAEEYRQNWLELERWVKTIKTNF